MPRQLIVLPPHIRKMLDEERGTEAPTSMRSDDALAFVAVSSGVAKLLSSPIENELQFGRRIGHYQQSVKIWTWTVCSPAWFPEQVFRVELMWQPLWLALPGYEGLPTLLRSGLQICTIEDRKRRTIARRPTADLIRHTDDIRLRTSTSPRLGS